MEKSYIYKITCKENNKFYVGSTVDFERRWTIHKSLLNNNKHHSKVLQNCWNKYGEDMFQFEVVETIDKQDKDFLLQREQYFLDTLKPELNICEIAGSCLGIKRTIEFGINKSLSQIGEKNHFFGKKHSDETKQKMKLKSTGRKHTSDTKEKISLSRKNKYKGTENPFSKFSEEEIRQIRKMREQGMLFREIGKIFNSPRQTIASIINGKTYSEVK